MKERAELKIQQRNVKLKHDANQHMKDQLQKQSEEIQKEAIEVQVEMNERKAADQIDAGNYI